MGTMDRVLPRISMLLWTLLTLCGVNAQTPYRLMKPPLDTPWTKDVGTNPWPEYPRPQLRRDTWHSLNGVWTYQAAQADDINTLPSLPLAQEVLTPSCIESGISGIMVMGVAHAWFGTNFTVPSGWDQHQRLLLNFEAVDYEATVFVNGQRAGFNRGGYNRFTLDISDHVKRNGTNEVLVFVFDPTDDVSIPNGKQVRQPSHIFYTPCTGIWQTVWLESVFTNHITGIDVAADMHGNVDVTVHSSNGVETDYEISVRSRDDDSHIQTHQGVSDKPFKFTVESPKLWSPSSPSLYDITVTLGSDVVETYTGFRTISSGIVRGVRRPLLNGKFVFQVGTLDQGYWPDGIYTPPTVEGMIYDLKVLKELGMNMVRKHIKVEPDLFYEACDKLGLLVIQDMPSMRVFDNRRPTDAEQTEWERQLQIMVNEHKSYPSIVTWVIYNEGWGQITDYFPEFALTDRIRQLDPTRLIDATSGWNDHGAGDFSDNHHYADPQCGTPYNSLPSSPHSASRIGFQGEFGGLGHRPADENLWPIQGAVDTINQTYELHADESSYNYRSHVLWELLRQQVEHFECSGAVYTQTTDVEGEVNGLVTYDRRVMRVNTTQWKADIQALYDTAETWA